MEADCLPSSPAWRQSSSVNFSASGFRGHTALCSRLRRPRPDRSQRNTRHSACGRLGNNSMADRRARCSCQGRALDDRGCVRAPAEFVHQSFARLWIHHWQRTDGISGDALGIEIIRHHQPAEHGGLMRPGAVLQMPHLATEIGLFHLRSAKVASSRLYWVRRSAFCRRRLFSIRREFA